MQLGFGSGVLVGTPTVDAFGNPLASPTPVQFGTLQDCDVSFSFDIKELFGQYQFPVAVGRGKGKIQGKAKFAQMNGLTLNSLFFGQAMVSGSLQEYIDTIGTAIPATPFSITPVVPTGGTWANDLGVIGPNSVQLTKVVSNPAAGQYTCTNGSYTFAAADAGNIVRISYQYTTASTTGKRITLSNVLMGTAPTFRADLMIPFNGRQFVLTLPACIGSKFSIATKLDDFTVPEFDWSSFADANNNVAYIALAE